MPHRILVVEDDTAIQGFCKTVLESAGFQVEACGTAAQAILSYQARPPDLLIIDIGLPDGNGLEVCQQMGLKPGGGLPFLFLTAQGDLKTRLECFKLGAQDYLQKPFAVEELLARVKVHLQVKQSHDKLAKKAYDLELLNRARQDLTDMIVHDLKTPLASIKGTLDLIRSRGLISEKDYQNLLDYAGTAAEFMLLMLNDLLDMGQAEQAGLKPKLEAVAVRVIVDKIEALFKGRLKKLEVRLVTRVPLDIDSVVTDQNLIFRVLVNLLSNALKVSQSDKSEIGLECARRDGAVRFTISDRGPGVPDRDKARIFEKYTTTQKDQDDEGGHSGIGLAFCRVATQALKGRIWVEDRPGGGSLFIVELPAKK